MKYQVKINHCGQVHEFYTTCKKESIALSNCIVKLEELLGLRHGALRYNITQKSWYEIKLKGG
jgi:hypothetical protein